ncbi:MAG: hypothetical protein RR293_03110 [Bacteroidales bacterium]
METSIDLHLNYSIKHLTDKSAGDRIRQSDEYGFFVMAVPLPLKQTDNESVYFGDKQMLSTNCSLMF